MIDEKKRRKSPDAPETHDRARPGGPIAVIGMAFRFPGDVKDEEEFWLALKEGRDLIGQIPPERWAVKELQHNKRAEPGRSVSFSAGVLSRIEQFDADFFGISPREAAWMDPQQRLLLELAFESMENAGLPPSAFAGSDCAVYVGVSGLDYGVHAAEDLASISSHMMTGNTLSITANRLSYVFDLRGPSLVVDTACSSSLVALHHACNCIRWGEASTALAGGVHLLLHPYSFVGFTKASMLSADGRCKPFDESANGYVRSEGGAVVLLKSLEKALEDGDDIQAVILASGVNADGGRKTGITIPSVEGQSELMRKVLSASGLSPHEVDFIEAHGTGTPVGDPVEAAAIGEVYGKQREKPLFISSVKANLGHLEPASGMASLVKTILALKKRALPPALHLHSPNPDIDFAGLKLQLVSQYTELATEGEKPLVAGVNSFGFGGANAHALLREHRPVMKTQAACPELPAPPLFLSARNSGALNALALEYAALLQGKSAQEYYDIAHAAAFGRARQEKRLAVKAGDADEAASLLAAHARGEAVKKVYSENKPPEKSGVAFVYSGNGSQWLGMGRALLAESDRFAEILGQMDEAMRPLSGFSLLQEMRAGPESSRLDDTTVAQPLIFALQIALTMMLREMGARPDAAAGHSVGEVAAAWASGALDLGQAVRVICARSKAQGLARGSGRMAAAGMSKEAAEALLAELGLRECVEIAGVNSPKDVTLTGGAAELAEVQRRVEAKGHFFRLLDIDYAFHSRHMEAIREQLAEDLAGLSPAPAGNALFVSAVNGEAVDGAELDAEYWWRNVRKPVRFDAVVKTLAERGCGVFVEIGPNAILQHYMRECLGAAKVKGRVLSTLRKGGDGIDRLTETALRLHMLADSPDLKAFFPNPARRVRLPNYPWRREPHSPPRTVEGLKGTGRRRRHPLLGWALPEAESCWENVLDPVMQPWLADHAVGGAMVFPGAAYAEMALAAAREAFGEAPYVVEELVIAAPMLFEEEHARSLRFSLSPGDGTFEISSRKRLSADPWTRHASGRLLQGAAPRACAAIKGPGPRAREVTASEHYALASSLGLEYGPAFRCFAGALADEKRLEGRLALPDFPDMEGTLLQPAALDACFQSLVSFFPKEAAENKGLAFLPVKCGRLELLGSAPPATFRAFLRRAAERSLQADFELMDENGALVARAADCRFRAARLTRPGKTGVSMWEAAPLARPLRPDRPASGSWSVEELKTELLSDFEKAASGRSAWFTHTLPLMEALVVAFAYEAAQALARQHPEDWLERFSGLHAGWLAELLLREGLIDESSGCLKPGEETDLPPAEDLWRSLLAKDPACLPGLLQIGRLGRNLVALSRGEADCEAFWQDLRRSPVVQALYDEDPAYAVTRLAAGKLLTRMSRTLTKGGRLRVLEISPGSSALPDAPDDVLEEDSFEYSLVLIDEDLRSPGQGRRSEKAGVRPVSTEPDQRQLGEALPQGLFDLVILRHSLHRAADPDAVMGLLRRRLAPGGILMLAERFPDWSADFVNGVAPKWWRKQDASLGGVRSPLTVPEAWMRSLAALGFEDVELLAEPAAASLAEGAYVVLARRPLEETPPLPEAEKAVWRLLGDKASLPLAGLLRDRLAAHGQSAFLAEGFEDAFAPEADHCVLLLGWDDEPEDAPKTLGLALRAAQALAGLERRPPRLWMVVRGGALASNLPAGWASSPAQGALWGLGRVVMNEFPSLRCSLIDLQAGAQDEEGAALLAEELLWNDGADELLLGRDGRYALALRELAEAEPAPVKDKDSWRLDFHAPGQLRNLRWVEQKERALREDEVEVLTKAAGLNFRDVMYALGLLPDEAVENGFAGASLGLEFSGVVLRAGDLVKTVKPGDAVVGFGSSCFASRIITRAGALARMPEGWSFATAAGMPTVFFTVYYALKHLAGLQKGERVLIHGAAGGVGIAAVQLARRLGAEVFATAGSDEKRDFVKLLGVRHVYDSRSLAFADAILEDTGGEGVDVALNSLAGEAMRRTLSLLKPFGRFLELGKRDFFENTPVGLRPFRNNICYYGIDADQLLTARADMASRLFEEVMDLFRQGHLAPPPYRAFSPASAVEAFRTMQQARHIGKLVLSFDGPPPAVEPSQPTRPQARFSKSDCWLISGGLGGFGLESARWLASRGVGNLILVSRRGPASPGAREVVEEFQKQGVNALALACDVADPCAVNALMEKAAKTMPPLTGALHAAAVFDDKALSGMDEASIEKVLSPKLLGAWNLHRASLGAPLRHFVLYSSVSAALGNPGQGNYVAANAGLESLAAKRRQMGLPAACVAWGPIKDAGYLTRNKEVRDGLEQRLGGGALSSSEALDLLDGILLENAPLRIAANFDWRTLSRILPSAEGVRFSVLNRHLDEPGDAMDGADILELLSEKSPEQAALIVQGLVARELAQILCIDAERIDPERRLHDLGMDSLMAVELALVLERRFGVQFPVMALNDSPTVVTVGALIMEKLFGGGRESADPALDSVVRDFAWQHGVDVAPEDLSALADDARALADSEARLIE